MDRQNVSTATYEQFVSQLKKEHGDYLPLQEKLANKQKDGKTYQTCWLQNRKTEQRVLGVMKNSGHISLVDNEEAKAFKFVK